MLGTEVEGMYEKMRVLGRGSFGTVMLVKDTKYHKLYAMKTMKYLGKKNPEANRGMRVREI